MELAIAIAATSDRQQIAVIYRATYERLLLSAYALTGSRAEAQDAVQEAFVRALRRPAKVLAAESAEAWLRTVTLNICRSRYQRRRRLETLLRRRSAEPEELPGVGHQRLELMEAIRRLPRPQAEAIALHHLADLPVEEVARTVGAPTGTVKARLTRGRAALARFLEDADEQA
jgi:RNA polymerase sigma-70 factor (ECF subfamily)